MSQILRPTAIIFAFLKGAYYIAIAPEHISTELFCLLHAVFVYTYLLIICSVMQMLKLFWGCES